MLLNTTLNTTTLACYDGTTPGSVASFFCSDIYELNTTTDERMCVMSGNNATWTGNPVACGKITLILMVHIITVLHMCTIEEARSLNG